MHQLQYIILEAVFWATTAVVAFVFSYEFNGVIPEYRYGATGWPRFLIYAIAVFAFAQTLWSLLELHQKGTVDVCKEEHVDATSGVSGPMVHVKRLANFGLALVYLFLIPKMGFYILTPFFIAGYMMLLGERRWLIVVAATVGFYALAMIVFLKLLFVPFPVGNWPGFYEINTYFVSIFK